MSRSGAGICLTITAALTLSTTAAAAQTTSPWNPLLVERAVNDHSSNNPVSLFTKPIIISSLENYFSVVGRFVGNVRVFEDSVVVELDTLVAARVHHGGPIRVTRLDSLRVGVGRGTSRSWSPTDESNALQVERVMPVGTRINLTPTRFVLPHARAEDDASAWLVVVFHLTVGRPGEKDYHPDATTYAHSARGILDRPPAAPAR